MPDRLAQCQVQQAHVLLQLLEIIRRYNNKENIQRYLSRPELLTTDLYRDFRDEAPTVIGNGIHRRRRLAPTRGMPREAISNPVQEVLLANSVESLVRC